VKELGKTLGNYVVIQNCSETYDYRAMGTIFSGVAQSGIWCCFDEFNRISMEVLSVVAVQAQTLFSAVSRAVKTFVLDGKEIPLNVHCAVFATLNPTYIGRSILPERYEDP
jgi:dynein heavy chain